MDKPLSHEDIEGAFQPAKDVLKRLPDDTTESKRAAEHLKLAENYVHETRDRTAKQDRAAPVDASVEMKINYHAVSAALIKPEYLYVGCPTHGYTCTTNNAQITGWPFSSPTTQWTWNDGSAP